MIKVQMPDPEFYVDTMCSSCDTVKTLVMLVNEQMYCYECIKHEFHMASYDIDDVPWS